MLTDDYFKEEYIRMLAQFPNGINFGFAYGSGVFRQSGHKSIKDNMTDLIFVVEDPYEWHKENIKRFPKHYSFLRHFGPSALARIQQSSFGANAYFNTLVRLNGNLVKYGVISDLDFTEDLKTWNKLYIAGRLHKPVLELVNINNKVDTIVKSNLQSALIAALLLLPFRFTERDLFVTITGLSYNGDFRMVVGEDKKKVENIVDPNLEHFKKLYEPVYESIDSLHRTSTSFEQDLSEKVTFSHLTRLPLHLKNHLVRKDQGINENSVLKRISCNKEETSKLVAAALSSIVLRSSITQSVKGIFTAGAMKTIVYSTRKLTKMAKGFLS